VVFDIGEIVSAIVATGNDRRLRGFGHVIYYDLPLPKIAWFWYLFNRLPTKTLPTENECTMSWVDKLDRKFGRYAIPNLTLLIVCGQITGFFLGKFNPEQLEQWFLIAGRVQEGDWWRLVTFPMVPPGLNILVMFCIYLFYLMGTALENTWGTFRYNVYLLIAYLCTVGVSFINPEDPATTSYIAGSVFLAFAWLYPEFELRLMFILPVKIKWLALLTWFIYFKTFFTGSDMDRLLVTAAILNFLIFFSGDIFLRLRYGKRVMQQATQKIRDSVKPFHRCEVCGTTEKDDIHMDFRICSTCTGGLEYCENHIRDHEHRE